MSSCTLNRRLLAVMLVIVAATVTWPEIVRGQTPQGSIVGWGKQVVGGDLSRDFVGIAAGTFHSLGVKADGSILAWGYNGSGQSNVPSPNTGFIAVAAGGYHSLGLKADGSIVAWGTNNIGQTNVPAPNTGFIAVAAGGDQSLGLKADGSIVAWGANSTNVPSPNTGFVAVAAGDYHSLGLKGNGSIVGWGDNSCSQTIVPSPNTGFVAIAAGRCSSLALKTDGSIVRLPGYGSDIPSPNTGFVAIAAGGSACDDHFLAIRADGSIVAWNHYGLIDVPAPNTGFIGIAAGGCHSLGLKADGSVVGWGDDNFAQATNVPSPNEGFVAVATSEANDWIYHSLGLKAGSSIVAWGWGEYDQSNVLSPNTGFVAVAAGDDFSLGLKSEGSIVSWGVNYEGQIDVPAPNSDFIGISAGESHSLGLKANGAIVAWGSNVDGELNVPAPNTGFVAVAAGWDYSLGLKSDGSIKAWGWNIYGQINVPLPNTGFIGIAAGGFHSLGLKADGSIVAWGANTYGQRNVPSPNTGFVAVAAGDYHSLGLKVDGSVVAWGRNNYGQTNVPAPNTGYVAIAAGEYNSLGVQRDTPVAMQLTVSADAPQDFGAVAVGATSSRSFIVRTTGLAIITGAASTSPPFSIVGDGIYTLSPGQSRTITVRYAPTSVGTHFGHITFTGPTTQTRQLFGSAFQTEASGFIAGTVTAAGVVAQETTNIPIAGAVVSANGMRTVSGSDGSYRIELQPGAYNLQGSATGNYLQTTYSNLLVSEGQTTTQHIVLPPLPAQTSPITQVPVLLVSGFSCEDVPWDQQNCGDQCDSHCEKNTWVHVRSLLGDSGFDLPNQDYVGEVVWDPNEPTPGVTPPDPLGGEIIKGNEHVETNARRLMGYVAEKVRQYKRGTVSPTEPQGRYPAEINIVASSMGGLITRRLLDLLQSEGLGVVDEQGNPRTPKVKKVIMLGTPNGGDHIADFATDPLIGAILAWHYKCGLPRPESLWDLRTDYVGKTFSTYSWPSGTDLYLHAGTGGASSACDKLKGGADELDRFYNSLNLLEDRISDGVVTVRSVRGLYYVWRRFFVWEVSFSPEVRNSFSIIPRECKQSALDHLQLKIDPAAVQWIGDTLSSTTPPPVGTGCQQSASFVASSGSVPNRQIELQAGTVAPGLSGEVQIPSDAVSNLTVTLLWDQDGLAVSLKDPTGTVVTPPEPGIDPRMVEYVIPQPALGNWTAVFDAGGVQQTPVNFAVLAFGDAAIGLSPNTEPEFLNLEEAPVAVFLGTSDPVTGIFAPTLGATVTVVVSAPDMTEYTLNLVDDGQHLDGAADDGMYAAVYTATTQPGNYQIQYRAEGTGPTPLPLRRVATGSFEVSTNVGRISGSPSDEAVDFNADGVTDYIRVQVLVTVQTAGDYAISGRLVDTVHNVSLSGSETLTNLPAGTAPVSLFFDCRATGVFGTIGPFALQDLQLFEQGTNGLAWVDRYRDTYTTQSVAVFGPPPPICGDGVVNQPGEQCDPPNDAACPGVCQPDCTCPPPLICGDGVVNQPGEQCDPPDDAACPGVCQPDCTCPPPANNIVWRPFGRCTLTPFGACTVDADCAPAMGTCKLWPNDDPEATVRSLRFRVVESAPGGTQKVDAIKVTLVDLQHPSPRNSPSSPPANFTTFDTQLNGVCTGGQYNGHHCDTDADCVGTTNGTCTPLAACTAAGETNGCARWVGKPGTFYESEGPPQSGPYRAARLQCTPFYWDWKSEGLMTVVGAEIVPSSEYSVQDYAVSCMGSEATCTNVSSPVTMYTRRLGDVDAPYNPGSLPITNQPNASDIAQLVNKFKNLLGAPVKARAQLQPNLPELNASINALDIVAVVDAFKGLAYAFSGPCPCPSTQTCGLPCTGCAGMCVKTCTGGANDGEPCISTAHCPGGVCSATGTCRDRCGRCTP